MKTRAFNITSTSILIAILGTKEFPEAPASPVTKLLLGPPRYLRRSFPRKSGTGYSDSDLQSHKASCPHKESEFSLTICMHVNMQFHSVVLSLKEETGYYASTQGDKETVQPLHLRGQWLEKGINLSQETKRSVMRVGRRQGKTGRKRQGELEEKSFCPEIRSLSQCWKI